MGQPPAIARKNYKTLLATQEPMVKDSENSAFNQLVDGPNKKLGIIASGIAYNYLMENFDGVSPYPVLKVCQYPLPYKQVEALYNQCDAACIMEEGYPIIEEMIKGFLAVGKPIHGRLDGTLPRDGEPYPCHCC